jgi:hypothetical protein
MNRPRMVKRAFVLLGVLSALATPGPASAASPLVPPRSALAVAGNRILWASMNNPPGNMRVSSLNVSDTFEPSADITPTVAVAPSGRGAVVWNKGLNYWDDASGGTTDVSIPPHSPVAMSRRGALVVLATYPDGTVAIARQPPGGGFGAFRQLARGVPKYQAALDVDRDGNALAAWIAPRKGHRTLYTRVLTATGKLLPTQRLSNPAEDAGDPVVVFGSGGAAVVAWRSGVAGSPWRSVNAAVRPLGGSFRGRQTVAGPVDGKALPFAGGPYLVAGRRISVFWARASDTRGRVQIRWRTQTRSGGFSAPHNLFTGFAALPPAAPPDAVGRTTTNSTGESILPWFRSSRRFATGSTAQLPVVSVIATYGDGDGHFCYSETVTSERQRHAGLQAGLMDSNQPVIGVETAGGGGRLYRLFSHSQVFVVC